MDVEFEEVEEGVGDEGDGAVELGLNAVLQFEGFAGFIAHGERDVLELVIFVRDVFACVAVANLVLVAR